VQISSYIDFISSIDTCISSILDKSILFSFVKLFFSTSIVCIFSKKTLFSLDMTSFLLVTAPHLSSTSSVSPCRTAMLECRESILQLRPSFSEDMSSELLHNFSCFEFISSIDVFISITVFSTVSFLFKKIISRCFYCLHLFC